LSPHGLDKFIVFTTHGRHFLEPSEFETQYLLLRRRYFRMLARGLLYPNGWTQFQYHRKGLKTVGYDLTLLKLSPYILYELLDIALNPKKTVGELMEALKKFGVVGNAVGSVANLARRNHLQTQSENQSTCNGSAPARGRS